MNHYERLKVSRDAPPEVIRAAYRALANKLHPDRNGGGQTGPDDAQHAQMAALNTAYETLMSPKARLAYDEALQLADAARPQAHSSAGADSTWAASSFRHTAAQTSRFAEDDSRQGPNTRIDMDWLTPRSAGSTALWPPTRRTALIGGGAATLLAVAVVAWMWQMWGQHQTERALSRQYASNPTPVAPESLPTRPMAPNSPAALAAAGVNPAVVAAAPRRPTVEELSRMSDEELLQVLPTLDDATAAAAAGLRAPVQPPLPVAAAPAANQPHPLDGGAPLSLRPERELVDPLAQ